MLQWSWDPGDITAIFTDRTGSHIVHSLEISQVNFLVMMAGAQTYMIV